MNRLINVLADSVLAKDFDTCNEQELHNLSDQYPYSSAIQLLYAQKLEENNSKGLDRQLQKTFLYYNNPLLVQYIVKNYNNKTVSGTENSLKKEEIFPEKVDIILDEDAITDIKKKENIEIEEIAEVTLEEKEEADTPALPEFKIEAIDPATAELSFTPYHTIDYFAAQGIKLGDEQITHDKFSSQLKSFTDWLKHMKRLPGATTKGNISVTEEKNIEKMAEQSLSGKNADTEAMAEVWIKQGFPGKAIEIYQKLSLQNPGKSAYFAAKIDHLKK